MAVLVAAARDVQVEVLTLDLRGENEGWLPSMSRWASSGMAAFAVS
jgi:hypothetical protein